MQESKIIGKREFIQHTSKYIKWVEEHKSVLVITHQNRPVMILSEIKPKTVTGLRKLAVVKVNGDINEPVLPGYDTW